MQKPLYFFFFFSLQTFCLKVQIFWRLMMQLAPSRTMWLPCCVTWRSHSCLTRMLPAGDILTAETRAGILTCKCQGHSVGFVHCFWDLTVDVLQIKRDWKLFLINCSLYWRAIGSLLCLNLIKSGPVLFKNTYKQQSWEINQWFQLFSPFLWRGGMDKCSHSVTCPW